MVQSKTILSSVPDVLKGIDVPGLQKQSGKVRDFFVFPDKRIIVTTDRQSAFDVNLGYIPFKGAVLNLLAGFWFKKTKHIVPNHLIDIPHPNILVAKNCEPIPIEMIVRGYISGVTKTSIWYSYERGERTIYGLPFPDGLKKNQQLPSPVITPTTHGGGAGGHDERLTREDILKRNLVSEKLYSQMEQAVLALFALGSKICKKQGLILVDTKYEFGLVDGKLTLMDEMHTPDSSPFWVASTYEKRLKKGLEPENFDKEFLRLWYAERGYRGDGEPPPMSNQLIVDLSQRYISVYEKITGETFKAYKYPIDADIKKSISRVVDTPSSLSYASTGVNYAAVDPVKIRAQQAAAATVTEDSVKEVPASRGESAYVWEETDGYRAFVIEGLGTKNLVADEMRKLSGKTYYDAIAQDTVAMIVNDLIVVGAKPQVVNAYFAASDAHWFTDTQRSNDLIHGWATACIQAGAVWGGGESPALKHIITPGTVDLAGSAIGSIHPKKRLTLGSKISAGDAILLIESSGIHANGLTLAREVAKNHPRGYKAKLSDGTLYGEALLSPTYIYAQLVEALFAAKVEIHYMVNITGHGWRKLMRASPSFTYRVSTIPTPRPVFSFIQKQAKINDQEMYGTFNMGAGFAIYIRPDDISLAMTIAKQHKFQCWNAGTVEHGPKRVVIEPKNIIFTEDTLFIRS